MKKYLLLTLAAVSTVTFLPACTTVVEDEKPTTHTTTTSESVVRRAPASATVESTSVRSY